MFVVSKPYSSSLIMLKIHDRILFKSLEIQATWPQPLSWEAGEAAHSL